VLLMLLPAVVAAREGEDQRILALDPAEGAIGAGVVGQRVVWDQAAGPDVGAHG
jgi:hypothetical protein